MPLALVLLAQALVLTPHQAKPLAIDPLPKITVNLSGFPALKPQEKDGGIHLNGGLGICWVTSVTVDQTARVTVVMDDRHEPITNASVGSEALRWNTPEDSCSYKIEKRKGGIGVRAHAANCMGPSMIGGGSGCQTVDVFYYAEPSPLHRTRRDRQLYTPGVLDR